MKIITFNCWLIEINHQLSQARLDTASQIAKWRCSLKLRSELPFISNMIFKWRSKALRAGYWLTSRFFLPQIVLHVNPQTCRKTPPLNTSGHARGQAHLHTGFHTLRMALPIRRRVRLKRQPSTSGAKSMQISTTTTMDWVLIICEKLMPDC